jgi:hypothetical protein
MTVPRICVVCKGEVKRPAIHFCSLPCVQAWIERAREREPVLVAKAVRTILRKK